MSAAITTVTTISAAARSVDSFSSSLDTYESAHYSGLFSVHYTGLSSLALLLNLFQFWAIAGGPSTIEARDEVLPRDIPSMPYGRASLSSSASSPKEKVALTSSSRSIKRNMIVASPSPTPDPEATKTAFRKQSALLMSISMALHFFGYEFARSANLSLFTSKTAGFSSPGAFPLAMACVSPFSFVLLMGYGRELSLRGPRAALRNTGLFCAAFLSLTGGGASVLDNASFALPLDEGCEHDHFQLGMLIPSKIMIWTSFIFQQSYAHLLYTQHWSFLGSVLTSAEGASYFSPIAGLSSLSSALAGAIVGKIVDKSGLGGLLGIASASLLLSILLADLAYGLSEKHDFDPAEEMKRKKAEKDKLSATKGQKEVGLLKKTRDMFDRVPVLGALFCEVISFQSLATILNVCMVTRLKEALTDDAVRAAWTGRFYAYVNGVSGLLQFVLLPIFLKHGDITWLWRSMPLLPLICTLITSMQASPSLNLLAFSFFAAKVIDYALRNVLSEMVYVPLDFDSRYLGKEVIGVFGNRFGKSGISLVLSGLGALFGSFGVSELTKITSVTGGIWFWCAYQLSNYIPSLGGDVDANNKKKL